MFTVHPVRLHGPPNAYRRRRARHARAISSRAYQLNAIYAVVNAVFVHYLHNTTSNQPADDQCKFLYCHFVLGRNGFHI
jgi:hypothetical protein